jgi:hypothetical protein
MNSETTSTAEEDRRKLAETRKALLALHRVLIGSERSVYERSAGTIPSAGAFLQLLTTDPWFAWLRPLSTLIVEIDEAFASKKPVADETFRMLLDASRQLIVPNEQADGFGRHYAEAIQRDPEVVTAHGDVIRTLA